MGLLRYARNDERRRNDERGEILNRVQDDGRGSG